MSAVRIILGLIMVSSIYNTYSQSPYKLEIDQFVSNCYVEIKKQIGGPYWNMFNL